MEKLKEIFEEYDMFLVGIGEEFQDSFSKAEISAEKAGTIFEEYARRAYLQELEQDKTIEAYQKLAELLQGKNYFVVTLCNDDKIYKAGLKEDRIVSPCGSHNFLQCEEVCTEEIYPAEDYVGLIEEGQEPRCPHCGKPLVMNHLGCRKYSEEGYLSQWKLYTKWLQGTLNKKLCVLELGVGMKYPSVVRWPFEKVVFFNQKSHLFRVHPSLYQLAEELKERGTSIAEEPIEFLQNESCGGSQNEFK